jgi:hypothetical protein
MTNTNCLADIKCPACGNEESFRIQATTLALVTDDGTDELGDMEWDDDSYAECAQCLKAGKLRDFQPTRERTLAMTTTLTHTPGPWDCDLDYIVAPDPNGRHPDIYIAEIAHSDDEGRVVSYEEQHANRQLIAAAPDLLAACQMVINRWEQGDLAEAARACADAIAKATAA